jgi:hypothetical protein
MVGRGERFEPSAGHELTEGPGVVLPRLRRVQRVAGVARHLAHLRAGVAERHAEQPGADPGRDRVYARSAVEPERRLVHDPTIHPSRAKAASPGSAFANSAQVAMIDLACRPIPTLR